MCVVYLHYFLMYANYFSFFFVIFISFYSLPEEILRKGKNFLE